MPVRLLRVRVWLEKNGLYPRSKLAFVTLYFLGLDLFLYLLQKLFAQFRPSYATALGGWTLFLTFVVGLLFCVLAARWSASRMLWRLRNRLIVTYVFIGVIPFFLLIVFAGSAFYLFSGQFATYIVTSRLDSELKRLHASNLYAARQAAAMLESNSQTSFLQVEPGAQVTGWVDSKQLLAAPDGSPALSLPPEQ